MNSGGKPSRLAKSGEISGEVSSSSPANQGQADITVQAQAALQGLATNAAAVNQDRAVLLSIKKVPF